MVSSDNTGANSINCIRGNFNLNKHSLKICHVNVENITVHRENFLETFDEPFFDIIAVSETFLKPTVSVTPFVLGSYNIIRHDREEKEGGGLLVYVKNFLNYKVLSTSRAKYCRKPEYVLLDESCYNWNLLVCVVYRPPKIGHL